MTYYLIFLSQVSVSCFRDVYIEHKTDVLVKQTSICVLNYVFSAADKAKDCGAWSRPDISATLDDNCCRYVGVVFLLQICNRYLTWGFHFLSRGG